MEQHVQTTESPGKVEKDSDTSNSGASDFSTLVTVLKIIMGAGGFAWPLAFVRTGIFGGIALVALVVTSLSFTSYELECLGHHVRSLTGKSSIAYSDVAHESIGPLGATLVQAAAVLGCAGACSAYLAYIGETVSLLMPTISKWLLIVGVAICLLPTVLSDDFSVLARCAFVGTAAVVAGYVAIAGFAVFSMPLLEDPPTFGNFEGILQAIGPVCFLLCFHFGFFTVQNASQSAVPGKSTQIANLGLIISGVLTGAFGCLGPLYFGKDVSSIVLNDIPSSSMVFVLLKLFMCLDLAGTFPVMFAVGYSNFDRLWVCCQTHTSDSATRALSESPETAYDSGGNTSSGEGTGPQAFTFLGVCSRVILLAIITFAGCSGGFGDIVSLTGCTSFPLLSLVFPPVMALRLLHREMSSCRLAVNVLMVASGVLLVGTATSDTIANILRSRVPDS
eukprot:TRINITY_DN16386_c0_g1_i1.p1 TRINITY_DN16386_c0_g1~~TRINITY_DN16386_c0_g1_i1.p1  ORF type:complete len:448 (+),score=38.35 TRINITY_DN16386_c0_g1_i1:136-1479(+)